MIFLLRIIESLTILLTRVSWPALLLHLVLLYVFGALTMGAVEPADSAFRSLWHYSWWFVVTITTVGYGDLAPTTASGQAIAGTIMIFGIGALGVALGKIGELFFAIGRKRMRGLAQLNERNHIVIFGYRPGETEQMVEEIMADPDCSRRVIVLCTPMVEENPLPDQVKFVQGDPTAEATLKRACVAEADLIIIHCRDDSQSIVTAIAAIAENDRAHIVAHLESRDSEKHLARISPRIECVTPMGVPMVVQALLDPGITRLVQALLSNVVDDVIYRMDIPESAPEWSFEKLLVGFKERYDAILVGVAESRSPTAQIKLNPPAGSRVRGGMALFYIASQRLVQVEWESF